MLKACETDAEGLCKLKCIRRRIYCRPLWFGDWVQGSVRECKDKLDYYDGFDLTEYNKPKEEVKILKKQQTLFGGSDEN